MLREVGADSDELLGGTTTFGLSLLPPSDCDSEIVLLRCQDEGGLPSAGRFDCVLPELPESEWRLLLCAEEPCSDERRSGMTATVITSGFGIAMLEERLCDLAASDPKLQRFSLLNLAFLCIRR